MERLGAGFCSCPGGTRPKHHLCRGVAWALPSLLTLHLCPQLIINEAAAQFCLRDNSLLLRRVELFSLSRQVARESTYLSSLKVAR